MLERPLTASPLVGTLGPFIASSSGPVIALILSTFGLSGRASSAPENQARGLAVGSRSHVILSWVENEISEHIKTRMQDWVTVARDSYDWKTIKLAAELVLEGERATLSKKEYNAERRLIKAFKSNSNPRQDSMNKYVALHGILCWCSFRRLRNGLDAAAREAKL